MRASIVSLTMAILIVTSIIMFTIPVQPAYTQDAGLKAAYDFEIDAQDKSGNGNHGTINGAVFVNGKIGKALQFDGVDDKVSTPSPVLTQLDGWTLVAWYRWSGSTGQNQILIYNGDSNNNGYGLILRPETIMK